MLDLTRPKAVAGNEFAAVFNEAWLTKPSRSFPRRKPYQTAVRFIMSQIILKNLQKLLKIVLQNIFQTCMCYICCF